MRRAVVLCVVLVALFTVPAAAQSPPSAAMKAEILDMMGLVPFDVLNARFPDLRATQYLNVIRFLVGDDHAPEDAAIVWAAVEIAQVARAIEILEAARAMRRADAAIRQADADGAIARRSRPLGRLGGNPFLYGTFGSPYSLKSPANPYVTTTPRLFGQDGRYLGKLSTNPYDPDSVSNPFGRYGNRFSPDSINNPFGRYGSPFSPLSPSNPFTVTPPIIVGPCPRPPC